MNQIPTDKQNPAKQVLIIDDDPTLLQILADGLAQEGYAITTEPGGAQGLKDAVFGHYDLVVMDLHMPGLNGAEAIRSFRLINMDVKILVLSGYVEQFQEELADLEVDAVLKKPTGLKNIVTTTQDLIGPARPEA